LAHITLSKSAFFHNLALLSEKLGSKEKLAIVLKDNAYGHGLMQIAELSQAFGLRRAVVRSFAEAEAIKKRFDQVLILNPRAPYIDDARYTLTINDLSQLLSVPSKSRIELKFDTGMHRNGLHADDLLEAFSRIKKRELLLIGVMTHFRSADVLSSELFWQMKRWEGIKNSVRDLCKAHSMPTPLFHSANSAAVLRLNSYEDDFARCGIAAYGYHEMAEVFGNYNLKPVMKLYGEKITTLTLKEGERIGYGGAFTAPEKMVVSTYDIGYGDGFFRYNGEGRFLLGDKPVLGKISMDTLSLPTDAKEVEILGDAKEIAHYFGTISYDLLVKLNPAIPRVIVH
jgi:alanine racemase